MEGDRRKEGNREEPVTEAPAGRLERPGHVMRRSRAAGWRRAYSTVYSTARWVSSQACTIERRSRPCWRMASSAFAAFSQASGVPIMNG
jgi:hypothetical protein